jgi:energy-coupling factor transport system ATP-binding protein
MRSLNEEGTGILLVSHDMDEVAALAKQVLVLDDGRVAMEGTCEEVFSRGGELARMGLSLPAPAAFMSATAQRGYPTEGVALTARQAARKLSALFGKRGGNGV